MDGQVILIYHDVLLVSKLAPLKFCTLKAKENRFKFASVYDQLLEGRNIRLQFAHKG